MIFIKLNLGTRFDQSKEVFGMSLGNLACGILGALPCTGVLIRTGVNVSSGATDKISQLINAIIVFLMIVILLPIFSYIPLPFIAAILFTSACRLLPIKYTYQLWNIDKVECGIMIFTAAVCIFLDGALGLLAGAFVALLKNAVENN